MRWCWGWRLGRWPWACPSGNAPLGCSVAELLEEEPGAGSKHEGSQEDAGSPKLASETLTQLTVQSQELVSGKSRSGLARRQASAGCQWVDTGKGRPTSQEPTLGDGRGSRAGKQGFDVVWEALHYQGPCSLLVAGPCGGRKPAPSLPGSLCPLLLRKLHLVTAGKGRTGQSQVCLELRGNGWIAGTVLSASYVQIKIYVYCNLNSDPNSVYVGFIKDRPAST